MPKITYSKYIVGTILSFFWEEDKIYFKTYMSCFFKFQNNLKNTIMGDEWWFMKLTKYRGVRRKLEIGNRNTDDVAAQEIERFTQDLQREERIKSRAEEIRHETSTVRKALLEARQFVDEII